MSKILTIRTNDIKIERRITELVAEGFLRRGNEKILFTALGEKHEKHVMKYLKGEG